MKIIFYHFLLGLLFVCFLSASTAKTTTNITTDQSALLALRAHILIHPHQILTNNWSVSSSVCEWIGVTCGSHHYRVIGLNISNMGLSGLIPPQLGNLSFLVSLDISINNFHGELPHELAWLRRLRVLNLGANNLNGDLPPWLGSFHELEYLSLMNNSFTGLIPSAISNMSKLITLRFSYNSLQGHIEKEIFNISSLEIIDLTNNSLSGSLPDYICQHLRRLYWLTLAKNKLTGQMPSSFGQCSQLQILTLAYNNFTGVIPKEIGNMTALEVLYLGQNSLEGEIPKEIGNLTMLKSLAIGYNNITGVIPREMSNLHNLEALILQVNSLTGTVPSDIFNHSRIRSISIGRNQLSGNLPSTLGYGLPNLEQLFLDMNNFSGHMPESIANSSKLSSIELSQNKFTGSIPNSLGSLSLLELLNLSDNDFTSYSSSLELSFITSLVNCKYLRILGVSNNPLHGFLPASIGNLSTSVERLYAYGCKIRGNIPDGIGNLSSLIILSLYNNQLSGSLPSTVKDLQKLQQIDLHMNQLSKVALDFLCDLQNLGSLFLGQNQILGSIPKCLGNVTSLRTVYLDSNRLNSALPSSICNLKDLLELDLNSNSLTGSLPPEINNFRLATLIDLSMNHFSGEIPNTIGDMPNLQILSLSDNELQGLIPESVGNMFSLETLDLSANFLSGSIPMSMEKLQYLTYLNVSFNNLTGEIPSEGPFTNFTSEYFISNNALCGASRFHVPPCPTISPHKQRTKKVRLIIFVLLGVITVVVAMAFGFVYLRYRKRDNALTDQAGSSLIVTQERISYYKLFQATDGYNESNLLGTGSFGSVYRGILEDSRVVAIKVFNLQQEGAFKSFDAECEILRSLRHRNITKVISSCSNPEFKALILEFMPNGSLEKWLYNDSYFLDVMQRLDILIDVANALQYLHYEYSTPVIHCDLKPSNVLLDQAMVARVSDFGIAKLLGLEDSMTYTKTLPTLGYIAPEYGSEGFVSTKCDVYSFGIMTMEVFTRMNPNNEMFGENLSLKSWVNDSMPNALANIMDAKLIRESDEYFLVKMECISSIMKLALNCTRESPTERSNIKDVLVALKKIKLQVLGYTEGHKA
ncbi:hypothetical protein ACH5RR_015961 [Cinchona calisaya]|uniref:non-specific serine/threonine protein kinase n=1 Tax=Cinchona calisaya TaxID=153742 RepID=A0ABD2ZY90_9GENT